MSNIMWTAMWGTGAAVAAAGLPKNAPWFLTLSFLGPHMPFDGIGLPDAARSTVEELALPDSSAADLLGKAAPLPDILKKIRAGEA